MSKKKATQEILPWNNGELETLLRGVISHGTEVAKIDFKTEIETITNEQKADLLKDIIAIANTFDNRYEDHGFIIYGVKAKAITGITTTESDTDKFQNHIRACRKISPLSHKNKQNCFWSRYVRVSGACSPGWRKPKINTIVPCLSSWNALFPPFQREL